MALPLAFRTSCNLCAELLAAVLAIVMLQCYSQVNDALRANTTSNFFTNHGTATFSLDFKSWLVKSNYVNSMSLDRQCLVSIRLQIYQLHRRFNIRIVRFCVDSLVVEQSIRAAVAYRSEW